MVNAENTEKYQENVRRAVESMIRKQNNENRTTWTTDPTKE